jgi:hypothetical protein
MFGNRYELEIIKLKHNAILVPIKVRFLFLEAFKVEPFPLVALLFL